MKPSDSLNTQEIHEIPALHSLVPCNSLVSKLILKKTAKDQGCLEIKGSTSPLHKVLRLLQFLSFYLQAKLLVSLPQKLTFCLLYVYLYAHFLAHLFDSFRHLL